MPFVFYIENSGKISFVELFVIGSCCRMSFHLHYRLSAYLGLFCLPETFAADVNNRIQKWSPYVKSKSTRCLLKDKVFFANLNRDFSAVLLRFIF